jgi:hypothetical protein
MVFSHLSPDAPRIRLVRPRRDYLYYILVDAQGERVGDRSWETLSSAKRYVRRNWSVEEEV